MKRIVIIQRRLTHYRVPLFAALRMALAERNAQLELLVGRATPAEEKKNDAGELPWARMIPTHYLAGGRLCWQPVQRHLAGADLVIVTQENKLIQNHLLMLASRCFKLAFWGHGANLQSDNPSGLKERFKRWTTNRVDWWFAYTQMSAGLVTAAGFPDTRITVLNNAVDTSELQRQRESVKVEETQALRESLGFGAGPVGVFVGSLYADKRLEFLFGASEAIRSVVPDFQLLIVGEGVERDKVQAWCDGKPWARWVGARFGREKVAYMSVAHVMLNPGALGLGIMDAFVCQTPMMTADCGNHGPEIAYLENDINGVITADDLKSYVAACVNVVRDAGTMETLRTGCAASAREYTVENMAIRFADGIARCLEAPRHSRRAS
ncbi:glycosyltransferase family 4 protein [Thiobacillus denitrificans]|uniref:glycosyltransferase family 4 protein n=1 Tax=Thiobacillus denitrificans TaxID=36861 RepID=UPI00056F0D13|nr:glycosyltransferase family 4 protein [Thiobacillus denitrificans]